MASYLTVSIDILACVTVFFIIGHTSLLVNIFQFKTAEAHSEPFRASEVELFAKMVYSLKTLTFFEKSSILDVLNASLN